MFNFIFRAVFISKKIREYERQALSHEFEASELYLDIRNSKGLIDAEREDIEANEGDIKQDEFEIEKCKKATDEELFDGYQQQLLQDGKQAGEVPPLAQLRKENNEQITRLQQEIKNLKAANEGALERIKQHEMDLRGVRDPNGKVLKQGHNTRYQGHMAAAQKARIHGDELIKFLKKSHKNKIKLAEEKENED